MIFSDLCEWLDDMNARAQRAESSDGRADEAMAREVSDEVGATSLASAKTRPTTEQRQTGMGSERPSPSETNNSTVAPRTGQMVGR